MPNKFKKSKKKTKFFLILILSIILNIILLISSSTFCYKYFNLKHDIVKFIEQTFKPESTDSAPLSNQS
jgi:hypothetical protein